MGTGPCGPWVVFRLLRTRTLSGSPGPAFQSSCPQAGFIPECTLWNGEVGVRSRLESRFINQESGHKHVIYTTLQSPAPSAHACSATPTVLGGCPWAGRQWSLPETPCSLAERDGLWKSLFPPGRFWKKLCASDSVPGRPGDPILNRARLGPRARAGSSLKAGVFSGSSCCTWGTSTA